MRLYMGNTGYYIEILRIGQMYKEIIKAGSESRTQDIILTMNVL